MNSLKMIAEAVRGCFRRASRGYVNTKRYFAPMALKRRAAMERVARRKARRQARKVKAAAVQHGDWKDVARRRQRKTRAGRLA